MPLSVSQIREMPKIGIDNNNNNDDDNNNKGRGQGIELELLDFSAVIPDSAIEQFVFVRPREVIWQINN